jgi:hypothetical protein
MSRGNQVQNECKRAAEIIADGDPPEWLLKPLPGFAGSLRNMIQAERAYPGRPEQRARLVAIRRAARLLERELNNLDLLMLLVPGDGDQIINENETRRGLSDVAIRADAALRQVPSGKGRARHYARRERFQNKDVCALIVTVAWKLARGAWPGVDNEVAKSACDALWNAVGGDIQRRGGEGLEVWKKHLTVARAHREGMEAKLIERNLKENRRTPVSRRPDETRIKMRFGLGK